MARTLAELPKGTRITDHISLGVLANTFPRPVVDEILERTGRASQRQRRLPAHVVLYYVIALALYAEVSYGEVLRCLLEGLRWLAFPSGDIAVAGKSGISQARSRLGVAPVKQLYERVVRPIAGARTKGAWYGRWRLVSLDGSTMNLADTAGNAAAFGRPGSPHGQAGYPQLRFVSLVENGTHVLFDTELGPYSTGEPALAEAVVGRLEADMLCLADRGFFSFALWNRAAAGGAALVWRIKKNLVLPCLRRLADGSYLSKIYVSPKHRRDNEDGRGVRVIEYRLVGIADAEPLYRLLTTLTDPAAAPAPEVAALYHERWEIETAFDELKTHLRGPRLVLRSKTPTLVEQEFYGFLLAHHAIRVLMHDAALKAGIDPDQVSFVHAVRVVRRKIPFFPALPPSASPGVS